MQEQTIFIGNIPLMNSLGTFIVNGIYRVVINQILQSPGIYYRSELDHNGVAVYTPDIAVKARRVSGSTHQVPIEIGSTQGKALAIRWLLGESRKRPGRNMAFKLSSELVDAAKGSGGAIRKKRVNICSILLVIMEQLCL